MASWPKALGFERPLRLYPGFRLNQLTCFFFLFSFSSIFFFFFFFVLFLFFFFVFCGAHWPSFLGVSLLYHSGYLMQAVFMRETSELEYILELSYVCGGIS